MADLNDIPLNALRAAEAVARLGSLSRAGAELGVSPGAVSQQVARAEAALRRGLFERRPGGMVPLEGTEEVFANLREGFARLTRAAEAARRDRSHVLTVSVAPIFAARFLIWRLSDFTRAHPDIQVRIDSTPGLIDFAASDIDIAVRIGPGGYSGVSCERLFGQRIVPVCSAELAARVAGPEDFARLPIIRDTSAMFGWDAWLGPEGAEVTLGGGPEFSEASLCFDAAMAGQGVFLAFEVLAHDPLARGQVVAPVPRWHDTEHAYWLLHAEGRSLSNPARLFRRWIKGAVKAEGLGGADG
ncbi:LysR substrate-binding domain-containing protein [Vannielia litorea]|uniref:LysR substrate-binding domain-containing protein n=1 Tax=Vannielia litorea TaxID=1217970 RepID=UPI001C95D21A|nr:LysR substrate-binding domain-containing protein [Vannielia litorea]MBY6048638.1 LysR family transcriptional regulator [Vannielia litorea]MBY6076052.1 LysR family transcriptional regulator [Vannielia litorea]